MAEQAHSPVVHGLIFCRAAEVAERGEVSLKNVLEILPVASFPGDAGPLTIVAFVRGLPPGPGEGSFVLRAPNSDGEPLGHWRLDMNVPDAYEGRQQCIHLKVPELVVNAGGWFEVAFLFNGTELAANRFLVGATGPSAAP